MNKKLFFLLIISYSFIKASDEPKATDKYELLYKKISPTEKYPHGYVESQGIRLPLSPATPLHDAIEKNEKITFDQLLSNPSIDVNQQDDGGDTPLHIAILHSHKNSYYMIELLKRDAKIDIKNNNGNNAIQIANNLTMDLERIIQGIKEYQTKTNNSHFSQFATWISSLWESKNSNSPAEDDASYEEDITDKLISMGGG